MDSEAPAKSWWRLVTLSAVAAASVYLGLVLCGFRNGVVESIRAVGTRNRATVLMLSLANCGIRFLSPHGYLRALGAGSSGLFRLLTLKFSGIASANAVSAIFAVLLGFDPLSIGGLSAKDQNPTSPPFLSKI